MNDIYSGEWVILGRPKGWFYIRLKNKIHLTFHNKIYGCTPGKSLSINMLLHYTENNTPEIIICYIMFTTCAYLNF